MTWIKKLAAVTAIASITSGCAMYRLAELRQVTPTGTPFQKELARLYMDFAVEDEKGYDWFNSWYFADKGLRAAYGKDVPPEDLKEWDIPADMLPAMERARGELMTALTAKNEEMHPTTAAQAQFYFDCWVQRQEENWQADRIDYCRQGLNTALDELGVSGSSTAKAPPEPKKKHHHKTVAAESKKAAEPQAEEVELSEEPKAEVETKKAAEPKASKEPKAEVAAAKKEAEPKAEAVENKKDAEPKTEATEAKKEAEPKAEAMETLSYVVFFAGDRPVITDPGEKVLDDVVKSLKDAGNYEIILKSGAGSKVHSKLFEDRAEAVTKRLVEGGINPEVIKSSGEPNPSARHVEIFLSQ